MKLNILFISKLSGQLYSGPNYSVPAQVKAQSQIDNVLWVNTHKHTPNCWKEQGLPILSYPELPHNRLASLPVPFCFPDLVVIEELYRHRFCSLIKDVRNAKIPYIVVPRSQLTAQGQKKKPLKKWLGNLLYYKSLVRGAVSIQYLTIQEKKDSGGLWNKHSFVLPNGINLPNLEPKTFSSNSINAVYIGRLEQYQKGLDLLIEACNSIQDDLRAVNFTLTLYGKDQANSLKILLKNVKRYHLEDIIYFCPPVFGEEKKQILKKADLFIMTSRFEGHPMGLIEALSYALPCIVTTGTNMREEIKDQNAGWTADPIAEDISMALKKAITECDKFPQKSANARLLAVKYDWNEIAQKNHQIYEDIIRGNK